jgi:hypothetical protein
MIDYSEHNGEHADEQAEIAEDRFIAMQLLFRLPKLPAVPKTFVSIMESRYTDNVKAGVNTVIACPVCSKHFKKTTYHKIFCSNQKTHGSGNCKDRYWNTVDPERTKRAESWQAKKR